MTAQEKFIAAHFEGHTLTEISKMLGISVSYTAVIARRMGLCKRKPRS